jgi:hypothetical protein
MSPQVVRRQSRQYVRVDLVLQLCQTSCIGVAPRGGDACLARR